MTNTRSGILAAFAIIISMSLIGCSPHGYAGSMSRDLTRAQAEETTNKWVDDAIAQIDPAQIRRIDEVRNEDHTCGDGVSNPTRKIKQWMTQHDIWLIEGADPMALLNLIIDDYVDEGWTITIDRPATELGGRVVQMLDDAANFDASFGLKLGASVDDEMVRVSSSSPCYDSTRK